MQRYGQERAFGAPNPDFMDDAMGESDHELLRFVGQVISKGPLDRIELRFLRANEPDAKVWSFDSDDIAGQSPDQLAMAIGEKADEDARMQQGGPVRYSLLAFRKTDPERAFARQLLHRDGATFDDGAVGPYDQPNEVGITSQHMRFTEATFRMGFGVMGDVNRTLARENRELRARITELETAQLQMYTVYQDLLDRKVERDLILMKAQGGERRKQYIFDQLKLFTPVVGRKLITHFAKGEDGKPLPGKSGDQVLGEAQIYAILASLTEEQLPALMKVLTPPQQAALFELFKAYKEKERQERGPSPEEQAAADAAKANGQNGASDQAKPPPPEGAGA